MVRVKLLVADVAVNSFLLHVGAYAAIPAFCGEVPCNYVGGVFHQNAVVKSKLTCSLYFK